MAMRRKLLPLAAMILMVCYGASSQEAPTPLEFEIKPEKVIIGTDQDFSLSITLRNTSKSDEQLNTMSCLSSHSPAWSSDNPDVHIKQAPCSQRGNFTLSLKPGETYHQTVSVRITSRPAHHKSTPPKETFRLGFFASDIPMQNVGTWSNSIAIVVRDARQ